MLSVPMNSCWVRLDAAVHLQASVMHLQAALSVMHLQDVNITVTITAISLFAMLLASVHSVMPTSVKEDHCEESRSLHVPAAYHGLLTTSPNAARPWLQTRSQPEIAHRFI